MASNEGTTQSSLTLLRSSATLMLTSSIPMVLWCLRPPEGAGFQFAATWAQLSTAVLYALSTVTALTALIFARRPHRWVWCQVLGTMQMSAVMVLALTQLGHAPFALLPLGFLTFLYLLAVTVAQPSKPFQKGNLGRG